MTASVRAVRPLRSVLFARGDDRDSLEKAVASGADSIVADLEEPRTPYTEADRERGRGVAREFFDAQPATADRGGAPLLFARVQPWTTGQTLKDLRAVMGPSLGGILIPKIESPTDVHAVDALLTCMEAECGLGLGSVVVYPILETADAIRLAYEIAIRLAAGHVHGWRDLALRRHPPGDRLPLDRRRARRRSSCARRCSSTRAPPAFAIRSAACGAATATTSTACAALR